MPIRIIDAPSHLGLKRPTADREPGVRFAPWQLRQLGIMDLLSALDGGVVTPPQYTGLIDSGTGVLHGRLLGDYAAQLADAITCYLKQNEFVVVLGGDCSLALGTGLALARHGQCGLVFLDGHRDLLLPQNSRSGGAAGMDLALITGHGPESLTQMEGHFPLLNPSEVLLFAYRDEDRWYDSGLLQRLASVMPSVSLQQARMQDIDRVFQGQLKALLSSSVEYFWIHFDVDVLDDALMFAVDARQPDGVTMEEIIRLLRSAIATGRCLGLHLTNYDPERDLNLSCARVLLEVLVQGLVDLKNHQRSG